MAGNQAIQQPVRVEQLYEYRHKAAKVFGINMKLLFITTFVVYKKGNEKVTIFVLTSQGICFFKLLILAYNCE